MRRRVLMKNGNTTGLRPVGARNLFKSDSGITESSGAVSEWVDSKGGVTAVQATSANQPTVISAALNGKAAIRFDGTTDRLAFSEIDLGHTHTIGLVLKNNNVTDITSVISGNTSTNYIGYPNEVPFVYRANNRAWRFDSGLRPQTYKHILIVRTPTEVKFYENGYDVPNSAESSITTSDTFKLVGISDFTGFLFNGDLVELAVWDRALSSPEIPLWEAYVFSEYGITSQATFPKNVALIGDSKIESTPTAGARQIKLQSLLGSEWSVKYFARASRRATAVLSDLTLTVLPKRDVTRTKDIVVVDCGINDLILDSKTGAETYAVVEDIHQALQSVGYSTIAVTMGPSTSNLISNQSTFNSERSAFNDLLIANWNSFSDAIIDFSEDVNIGVDGASDNATYYSDKLHYTVAGLNYFEENYEHPAILSI